MNRIHLAGLVLVLVLPWAAFAQGSGSMHPPSPNPSASGTIEDTTRLQPFAVTQSARVKIIDVKADQHLLIVEDQDGRHHDLKVDSKTRFKPERKTDRSEKKDLSVADLRTGQVLKVTFRVSDGTATEIQLRKSEH
jgi:hypothetical protein